MMRDLRVTVLWGYFLLFLSFIHLIPLRDSDFHWGICACLCVSPSSLRVLSSCSRSVAHCSALASRCLSPQDTVSGVWGPSELPPWLSLEVHFPCLTCTWNCVKLEVLQTSCCHRETDLKSTCKEWWSRTQWCREIGSLWHHLSPWSMKASTITKTSDTWTNKLSSFIDFSITANIINDISPPPLHSPKIWGQFHNLFTPTLAVITGDFKRYWLELFISQSALISEVVNTESLLY